MQSVFAQIDALREKNARNGSREATVRLNRIYECMSQTMAEMCIEDESSSSTAVVAAQDRQAEELRPASGDLAEWPDGPRPQRLRGATDARERHGSRFARLFCRKPAATAAVLGRDGVRYAADKNEVDLKMESARMHAVILNDEQLSQYKQVSL